MRVSDIKGYAFAWPERPEIGASVQLNAGSQRLQILRYEGDVAVLRTDQGDRFEFNWRVLRPWIVH